MPVIKAAIITPNARGCNSIGIVLGHNEAVEKVFFGETHVCNSLILR